MHYNSPIAVSDTIKSTQVEYDSDTMSLGSETFHYQPLTVKDHKLVAICDNLQRLLHDELMLPLTNKKFTRYNCLNIYMYIYIYIYIYIYANDTIYRHVHKHEQYTISSIPGYYIVNNVIASVILIYLYIYIYHIYIYIYIYIYYFTSLLNVSIV